MTRSLFLSPSDLKQLTGKVKGPEQHAELNKNGIDHIVRSDKEVVVLKDVLKKHCGLMGQESNTKRSEPNFGAIRR